MQPSRCANAVASASSDVGRDGEVRETELDRDCSGDAVAGQQVLLHPKHARHEGPRHGAAVTGNERNGDVRVGEERRLVDEDDVAERGKRAPEPDRRPVDRGDDWQMEVQHVFDKAARITQRLATCAEVGAVVLELIDAPAGAECPPGARQHDRPRVAVSGDASPEIGELVVERRLRRRSSDLGCSA